LREAVAVSLCLVIVRIVWVLPTAYIFRGLGRRLRGRPVEVPNWRDVVFIAWAGLRGGDSLVLALALPLVTMSGDRFPARDQIVFITFFVIFFSLVIQGPTLAPLARRLGVCRDTEDEKEEAHARLVAAEAGLKVLHDPELTASAYPEVVRYLRQRERRRARRWAAREKQYRAAGDHGHNHSIAAPTEDVDALDRVRAKEYRRLRSAMLDAEHRAVLELRDRDEIADDVMRRVQRELDLEAVLLGGSEPVIEAPREVASSIDASSRR
jgi:CPA1 family monovalent cation:H+ antiporter